MEAFESQEHSLVNEYNNGSHHVGQPMETAYGGSNIMNLESAVFSDDLNSMMIKWGVARPPHSQMWKPIGANGIWPSTGATFFA